VGARVYLTTTDGRTQLREVMAGSSLGAGNDLALNFGLGGAGVSNLRVLWPDGLEQTFAEVPSDVFWQLDYGGEPETSPPLSRPCRARHSESPNSSPLVGAFEPEGI
jgi:hypothetical protein